MVDTRAMAGHHDPSNDPDLGEQLVLRERREVEEPRRFKVLLHNDDYTTMEFVVHVLLKYFRKSGFEANQIMLRVHEDGVGVAGVYPFDVAETKVAQVIREAREQGMPLQLTLEAE